MNSIDKIKDLRERFKACAIHAGSDEEIAEAACGQFDVAIGNCHLVALSLRDLLEAIESKDDFRAGELPNWQRLVALGRKALERLDADARTRLEILRHNIDRCDMQRACFEEEFARIAGSSK